MTDPGSEAPRAAEPGRGFWVALVVGTAIMAFGVRGAVMNAAGSHPVAMLIGIVGGDLLHDFLVVPVVLLVGAVVARIVPEPWRSPARAGLFLSALLVAIAWPALRGYGRARVPDNHSVQPLDYASAVLIVLAIVWIGVACWSCLRLRNRRETRAPRE